jgi:CubicO group peptidase (beta-lactamase class C family)
MEFKKTIQIIFLLAILVGLSNCKKSNSDRFYDRKYVKEIKEARKEIFFYMSRNFVPGGSFAIAKDGKLVYSEGLGLASNDLEVPVNRKTKFRVGPVTEIFTSLAYQRMVEQGILQPDSSIQYYLPDFPEKPIKITLDNLVNHTSGIREPREDEKEWRGLNVPISKGIEQFQNDDLLFPPGMYSSITMFNYNLLGAVMEKATGEKFSALLKKWVTDTLQLENTIIDSPFTTVKGRTNFFDHNVIAQVINATFIDVRYRAPSGGLLSNAEDLVKFGNAMLYSDIITDSIRNKLFTPVELGIQLPSNFSNGWFISQDMAGRTYYGRVGGITGGGAALLIYPKEKLVIAGTVNLTSGTEDLPVFQMAKPFLPETKTEDKAVESNSIKEETPTGAADSVPNR